MHIICTLYACLLIYLQGEFVHVSYVLGAWLMSFKPTLERPGSLFSEKIQ